MYQVTFSEQSIGELNQLGQLAQLEAIGPISRLTAGDLAHPREPLGKFSRAGRELYRLRSGGHRFYFEAREGETLHVIYILHQNSLEDFLLRNKLPVSESQLVEQHSKFWKYLESLTQPKAK
jgi:mRNA interferase RelE/StbE